MRVVAVATRTDRGAARKPTVAESGYPGYEADIWYGWKGKDAEGNTAQLAGMFTAAMQAPEVKAKLVTQGNDVWR